MLNARIIVKILGIKIVVLSLLSTGCVTMEGHAEESIPGIDSTVVTQGGRSDPVAASKGTNYYIDLRSKSKDALLKMHGALATGEYEAAEDLARAYLRRKPGHYGATAILASSLVMAKKYDLAAYYATLLLKMNPADGTALNIKGIAKMLAAGNGMSDYRKALRLFQASFAAEGVQIASGLNMGHLYLELGNSSDAQRVFLETKKRCQGCAASGLGYGIASARLEQYKLARESLEEVLEKFPDHPRALYHLALVHRNGYNDRDQAQELLSELIKTHDGKSIMAERAHTLLRMMKGESDTKIAKKRAEPKVIPQQNPEDARLLMTGSNFEEE
jgi:tetratricopeptide (TPR) repeat protein